MTAPEVIGAAALGLAGGVTGGLLAAGGAAAGVVLANVLPQRALQLLFAAVMLYFAVSLLRRALRV